MFQYIVVCYKIKSIFVSSKKVKVLNYEGLRFLNCIYF